MMTGLSPQASLEEVLESFSIEHDVGTATLQKYLTAYPAFANEIIDLSREMARTLAEDEEPLSEYDLRLINSAVTRIQNAPGKMIIDPFADLSAQKMRDISKALNLPRQVLMAFKERTVVVGSIPQRFLSRLAELLQSSVQQLTTSLEQLPMAVAGSYKSDGKPSNVEKISFEQTLRDADLSEEDIATLMEEDI
ncbi:TPA: hypothetical protein ACKFMW_002865 [Enterobacter hormaechei]|jgi:hypothetical protein|uniref:hypothetical protein n=1 Tax=Enterobacter cloacae complex TaxID=354276 RepID=UPI0005CF96DE|nr:MULTISPECIES: hypothetical protein [Enterobacter cloacae complex]ELX7458938.1 hypothetical protein [Enterobacter hormaechei subsp. hoffmannii]EJV4649584.1 hypothetical protein [Enterobacter hormaechei]ELC6312543.1 hypothetical protein [Enterobacter hormaechei]ELH4049772.1 hypothetical protein [Enterobacter hormaechei]ELI6761884.1 hypothetical protein [Enterobacter hormaechei subsp. xiangfangensis]